MSEHEGLIDAAGFSTHSERNSSSFFRKNVFVGPSPGKLLEASAVKYAVFGQLEQMAVKNLLIEVEFTCRG
jgi:hypothetical protein